MDALNMTIEARDQQIVELKDSVVMAEVKTRKAMEKLSKIQAGEAQENIDRSIDFLNKKMGADFGRHEMINRQGLVSNSNNRLNSYLGSKTPELPAFNIKENDTQRSIEENSFRMMDAQPSSVRPARLLQ